MIAVTANKTVTANFAPVPPAVYTVTTGVNLPGSGTVSGGGAFASGSTATLSAAPAAGYRFSYWSGDASGKVTPVTIAVTSNKTVRSEEPRVAKACRTGRSREH